VLGGRALDARDAAAFAGAGGADAAHVVAAVDVAGVGVFAGLVHANVA